MATSVSEPPFNTTTSPPHSDWIIFTSTLRTVAETSACHENRRTSDLCRWRAVRCAQTFYLPLEHVFVLWFFYIITLKMDHCYCGGRCARRVWHRWHCTTLHHTAPYYDVIIRWIIVMSAVPDVFGIKNGTDTVVSIYAEVETMDLVRETTRTSCVGSTALLCQRNATVELTAHILLPFFFVFCFFIFLFLSFSPSSMLTCLLANSILMTYVNTAAFQRSRFASLVQVGVRAWWRMFTHKHTPAHYWARVHKRRGSTFLQVSNIELLLNTTCI